MNSQVISGSAFSHLKTGPSLSDVSFTTNAIWSALQDKVTSAEMGQDRTEVTIDDQ